MKTKETVKNKLRARHIRRIRKKISGTPEKPRLVVKRGLRNVVAQIVDDVNNKTLCTVDSCSASYNDVKKKNSSKQELSKQVGLDIAKLAKTLKVKTVVFDRRNYKYHGRVKMLAEGPREGGLEF